MDTSLSITYGRPLVPAATELTVVPAMAAEGVQAAAGQTVRHLFRVLGAGVRGAAPVDAEVTLLSEVRVEEVRSVYSQSIPLDLKS